MWRAEPQENSNGTWRVDVWDQGSGHIKEKNPRKVIHRDNIPTREEAFRLAAEIQQQLNKE